MKRILFVDDEPKVLDGLRRMRDNLQFGADDHPALERLNAYLDELSRRFPN